MNHSISILSAIMLIVLQTQPGYGQCEGPGGSGGGVSAADPTFIFPPTRDVVPNGDKPLVDIGDEGEKNVVLTRNRITQTPRM